MKKKPQGKAIKEEDLPKSSENKEVSGSDPSWETDQRERSYYYDDAYGYEKYVPKDDENQDSEK